jgi:hypothetical protein
LTFEGPNGDRIRLNTVDTLLDGTMTTREYANFDRIFEQTGEPVIAIQKYTSHENVVNQRLGLMQRQLQLFLSRQDESDFSRLLIKQFPGILFLNDNVWSISPDCRAGIEECDSNRVYLYNGTIETLPILRAGDRLTGPVSGCVIQILRCRNRGGALLSGSVAVGFDKDDEKMRRFVKGVWKCLKRVGTIGVVRLNGIVDNHYLVGIDARKEAVDRVIQLVDRSVEIRFLPVGDF